LNDRIPSVSAAHASGADQAMKHLLGLGHRRIGAITGPAGWVATEDRRRGYHAALAEAGIPAEPALDVEADFEIVDGLQASRPRRPERYSARQPGYATVSTTLPVFCCVST